MVFDLCTPKAANRAHSALLANVGLKMRPVPSKITVESRARSG